MQGPCQVHDVAGLVAVMHIRSQEKLCTRRHTVGQHRLTLYLPDCRSGEVQVFRLARIGIEQQWQFQHLAEGHAVHIEGLAAGDSRLVDREFPLDGPCVLSQLQQLLVARLAIRPQDTFQRHDVSSAHDAASQLVGSEVQVVLLQCLRNALVAVVLIFRLQHSEEHRHRPCDALQRLVSHHPLVSRVRQRIFDALHRLVHHLLGIQLIAQSQQRVGIVGRLLIAPPVVAIALVRA